VTDGQENASREFISKDQIFKMIEDQKKNFKWEFIYLAANQDAISVGASYGIAAGSSMSCNANSASTQATYDILSKKLSDVRSSNATSVTFNDQDRFAASQ